MRWTWKLGRIALLLAGTAGVAVLGVGRGGAQGAETAVGCAAPFELVRLVHPLKRTADKLASGETLTVVAIGSSSTAGAGASSPAANYPSRLAAELRQRYPGHDIRVLNRGVNGEEARDMFARFDSDVLAEKPDLVLWQVGTNSVLRDHPAANTGRFIREGVRRLRASGADVVLIDPQFAPRVLAKPEAEGMVALISAAAKEANVDLFQRFAVMRYWHDHDDMPFAVFVTPDDLHMNDWGYGCWAKLLGSAIADSVSRASLQSVATRRTLIGHPAGP